MPKRISVRSDKTLSSLRSRHFSMGANGNAVNFLKIIDRSFIDDDQLKPSKSFIAVVIFIFFGISIFRYKFHFELPPLNISFNRRFSYRCLRTFRI